MLGWLRWGEGRTVKLSSERLLGLAVLRVDLPRQSRRPERTVRRGAELLRRQRVTHVVTPSEFEWWPVLEQAGLRKVDTRSLRRALAPEWVLLKLAQQGIPPGQACLCLRGRREDGDMEQVAHRLCGTVRNLVIDVPGGGLLAHRLRREFGIAVLPAASAGWHLILEFDSGPVLPGTRILLKEGELPEDCDALALMGALWEAGRVKPEEIAIQL